MSFDDDKKRKGKEKPSKSNPEGWRQDRLKELRRELEAEERKKGLNELRMKTLKQEIKEMEEKSRPERDRRQQVASADEKVSTSSASEFTEKTIKREEERQSALNQAPEKAGEDVG